METWTTIDEDAPRDIENLSLLLTSDSEYAADCLSKIWFAYTGGPPQSSSFPGPNPISMDVEHLDLVRFNDYVCSPKVDGSRMTLIVQGHGPQSCVLLVDRSMKVARATFVDVPDLWFMDQGTVLDAEWAPPYLFVFDVVMFCGTRVGAMNYRERMKLLHESRGEIHVGHTEMVVIPKPIFEKGEAHRLFGGDWEWGEIKLDGLVFTPVNEPIKIFTHWHMFKVKKHHTIDLRLVCIPKKQSNAAQASSHSTIPSPLPEAIAQRMRSQIMQHAIAPRTQAGAPPRKGSLMSMVSRAQPATAATATATATAATRDPHDASPLQWLTRLEFSHGANAIDATTAGIDYAGRKFVLRIRDTPLFAKLLDKLEAVWRTRSAGDVVCMSFIAEFCVDVEGFAGTSAPFVEVDLVRTRPDKTEPNTYNTLTRTITSMLQGVTAEHLSKLSVG
jgi:hypothetical protein